MKSIVVFVKLAFIFFNGVNYVEMSISYNTIPEKIEYRKIEETRVISKICLLKPDKGPCRANIMMFYYDPRPDKNGCGSTFSWGGCQGNGNRFDTRRECEDNCLSNSTSTATRPRYCYLSFDYGFCFGAAKRYYYNHIWKTCHEAIYSGCGGNKNNFYSMEQCDAICRFGKGALNEKPKKKVGDIRKIIIVNPLKTTTQKSTTCNQNTIAADSLQDALDTAQSTPAGKNGK